MTGIMEILKICLEEPLLIKTYVIKYLILLNIQNMMDINADLLASTISKVFDKKTFVGGFMV